MRTRLIDIKNSRIPFVIGECPTSQRFIDIVNEAQERLLPKGHWIGTVNRYRICATSGCITLPPQIATVEQAAVCGWPVQVRDYWYEFLENGIGLRDNLSAMNEAIYRGNFPTYDDIRGSGNKLRWLCDVSADVGKRVLSLGYDDATPPNWIRTQVNGTWQDGEIVMLSQSPGTNSTHNFSVVTGIQFLDAPMNGQSWLYEYQPTMTQRLIGQYQAWETVADYPRYFFPSLVVGGACCGSGTGSGCTTSRVDIMAKLAFVPAVNDNDYLIIRNRPALKEMAMAINASEHEEDGVKKAQILAAGYKAAIYELDTELDHYLGSGRRTGITVTGSSIGEVCPVEALL